MKIIDKTPLVIPLGNVINIFDSIKKKHADALILIRHGDFYETFRDDAHESCRVLGINLTRYEGTPMAGFPYYCLDDYLPKIVRAGHRVAICDTID